MRCVADWGWGNLSDLVEQLRRYGEAVEEEARRVEDGEVVVALRWWRRQPMARLAAAAVVVVLSVGGVTMQLVRTGSRVKVVATDPQTPFGPVTSPPSAATDAPTTTTPLVPASETVTTTTAATPLVRPPSTTGPLLQTPPPATAPAPATTSPVPPATAAPSSATTTSPPTTPPVRGTATWIGGRDPRGVLRVGACPASQSAAGCPGWRWAVVASDGSYELPLSAGGSARDWKVAAFVSISESYCVFNCEWRNVQVGPSVTVSDSAPPQSLDLTVAARIVDVFVRDRNNRPFEGAGVMVRDVRCPRIPCPYDLSPMYSRASSANGAARIVVDSDADYELEGMAANTGWANPQYTSSEGSQFWFSPTLKAKGSGVPEGHTFLVDGAPS